ALYYRLDSFRTSDSTTPHSTKPDCSNQRGRLASVCFCRTSGRSPRASLSPTAFDGTERRTRSRRHLSRELRRISEPDQAVAQYQFRKACRAIGNSGGRVLALRGMWDRLNLRQSSAERGVCTTRNCRRSFCQRLVADEQLASSASLAPH